MPPCGFNRGCCSKRPYQPRVGFLMKKWLFAMGAAIILGCSSAPPTMKPTYTVTPLTIDNTVPDMRAIIEEKLKRELQPDSKVECRSTIHQEIELVDCMMFDGGQPIFLMGQYDLRIESSIAQQWVGMNYIPMTDMGDYGILATCLGEGEYKTMEESDCTTEAISVREFFLYTQAAKQMW